MASLLSLQTKLRSAPTPVGARVLIGLLARFRCSDRKSRPKRTLPSTRQSASPMTQAQLKCTVIRVATVHLGTLFRVITEGHTCTGAPAAPAVSQAESRFGSRIGSLLIPCADFLGVQPNCSRQSARQSARTYARSPLACFPRMGVRSVYGLAAVLETVVKRYVCVCCRRPAGGTKLTRACCQQTR